MAKITIKDDSTLYDRLTSDLNKLKGAVLIVGVVGDEPHSEENEITMPELAAVHEYGVKIKVTDAMRGYFQAIGYPMKSSTTQIEIPERSFIRKTYDDKEKDIRRKAKSLVKRLIQGKITAQQLMDKLGVLVVSMIRKTIDDIDSPPLSQMTKDRRKGKSGKESPLQDTGRLWQSIDYEVRW